MGLWVMNADGSGMKPLLHAGAEHAAVRRPLVAGFKSDRLCPRYLTGNRRQTANQHRQRRRQRQQGADPAQGLRGVAALVAGRQTPRLGQHARRQSRDLHRRRRGQEHPTTDAAKRRSTTIPAGRRTASRSPSPAAAAGNFEIHVMNADGSNVRRLTKHRALDYWPAWSPDGKRIAFTSNRDGNYEIYVMNADGSGLRNLTRHRAQDNLRRLVAGRQAHRLHLQPRRRPRCVRDGSEEELTTESQRTQRRKKRKRNTK